MAKFITGQALEDAVYDIIWHAKEKLLIVSPYIKLGDYFMKLFDNHKNNFDLHLILVFGKNEGDTNKSLGKNDLEFFKKFPNVSIIYVPNLHAKYYGNEQKGVITSINLYDYSFKNNIEFGVYSETSFIDRIKQSADQEAWGKCMDIADEGIPVFIKRPVFQKKFMSSITGSKNYMRSEVLHDNTGAFYIAHGEKIKRLPDYPDEVDYETQSEARPTRAEVERKETGFCIRTRKEIPFNLSKPFCYEEYKIWAQHGNPDFKEKYCHKTGRPSGGETSMRNPVLK